MCLLVAKKGPLINDSFQSFFTGYKVVMLGLFPAILLLLLSFALVSFYSTSTLHALHVYLQMFVQDRAKRFCYT